MFNGDVTKFDIASSYNTLEARKSRPTADKGTRKGGRRATEPESTDIMGVTGIIDTAEIKQAGSSISPSKSRNTQDGIRNS